jgi:hypothetical protein
VHELILDVSNSWFCSETKFLHLFRPLLQGVMKAVEEEKPQKKEE